MKTSPSALKRRAVTSFSVLILGLLLLSFAFRSMRTALPIENVPWPLRKALNFNGFLWQTLNFQTQEKVTSVIPRGKPARVNGNIGLSPMEFKTWHLTIHTPPQNGKTPGEIVISLKEIMSLPRTEIVTQFKCIEGWSEYMSFAGIRFRDFLNHYRLGTHSGESIGLSRNRQDLYQYVGLETPDEEYYVSVDMPSMLRDETLLAYEQNGVLLAPEHGAPLRLVIPSKYGVKNLKRIGQITFSDERLPDYWGEQGYDWFLGL